MKKLALFLLLAIMICSFTACGFVVDEPTVTPADSSATDSGKSENKTTEPADESGEAKDDGNKSDTMIVHVGEKLTNSGLEITFVSAEDYTSDNMFIQPGDGKKFIRLYFECKNVGDSDHHISYFDFDCYADDEKCDASYFDDGLLSATISAGRSTKGYAFFEVPKNAEHIEVEYELNLFTGEKAIFLVK